MIPDRFNAVCQAVLVTSARMGCGKGRSIDTSGYSLPYEKTRHAGVGVGGLSSEVAVGNNDDGLLEPEEEVRLALANLARRGCIAIGKSIGGGEVFKKVNPTLLGRSFVEACTLQVA